MVFLAPVPVGSQYRVPRVHWLLDRVMPVRGVVADALHDVGVPGVWVGGSLLKFDILPVCWCVLRCDAGDPLDSPGNCRS